MQERHVAYAGERRDVNLAHLVSDTEVEATHGNLNESMVSGATSVGGKSEIQEMESSTSSVYSAYTRHSSHASFSDGLIQDPTSDMTFLEDVAARHAVAQGVFVQLIENFRDRLDQAQRDFRSINTQTADIGLRYSEEVRNVELKYGERERCLVRRWWQHAKQQHDEKLRYVSMYNSCLGRCKHLESELESVGNASEVLQEHNRELMDQLTSIQLQGAFSGMRKGQHPGKQSPAPPPTAVSLCSACNNKMINSEVHFKHLHTKKRQAVVPRPPHKETMSRVTPFQGRSSLAPALGDHVNMCVLRYMSQPSK
eukprot:TRINITY_DN59946_c0_g1_i1.p1 TRINITY_DN59946_c0_g1~~TRINITY_DN59946_c0_g1_i1.p1  ORF type:complete len:332 (+),score=120.41 TRINITY_DN59946_c0_g1_i1:65-997(+)